MNYSGTSFDSTWSDGHLYIHAKEFTSNCLDLLKIVLDAGVSQGAFDLTIDLRHFRWPSFLNSFTMLSFANGVQGDLRRTCDRLVLLVDSYMPFWRGVGRSCMLKNVLVTNNTKDAKLYIS